MAGLMDFLQAASNAAASNVSGPIDLLGWALNKAGVPVGDPVGGSAWMKKKGLMRDVPQSAASLAGETVGLLSPIAAAQYAPQIASGLLKAQEAAKPTIANMAENYMARTGMLQPATVWHGSPHKFDAEQLVRLPDGSEVYVGGRYNQLKEAPPGSTLIKDFPLGRFRPEGIGTGEGAQAYGYGHYAAGAQDVAMTYQPRDPKLEQRLMQRYSVAERSQQYPAMQVFEDFLLHKTPDEVAQNIAAAGYSPSDLKAAQDALKIATKEYNNQRAGALYKVDLPDSAIARMLDWDKPLSQQAPEVQKALQDALHPTVAHWAKNSATNPAYNGADLWARLSSQNKSVASEMLRQQGILGIRYLDGGSRGAGSGTSNYVVFPGEEGALRIMERNGKTVGY